MPAKNSTSKKYDMVVFCHLRWDFVYQRPQHIINRLSKTNKILFIEEPWHREGERYGRLTKINDNLDVLQPNVHSIEEIALILPHYTETDVATGWFYSASFVPLLEHFSFDTIIYDCMDELSLFKGAPEKLIRQEKELIFSSSIVFTGGKSLFESKKPLHHRVYCFPSSVDCDHFARALNGISTPTDIAVINSPIVGYYGVIDERIDFDLINHTAILRPDISFVMIGPLAKISDHDLPRQPNIHYLGMKDYNELPGYLKGITLAMMPFALNNATKFISPTKTLEYMAAGKPIISTAITDVVRDYSHCVSIISTPDEFSNAIDAALVNNSEHINHAYTEILNNTSWDNTVLQMEFLIKEAVV